MTIRNGEESIIRELTIPTCHSYKGIPVHLTYRGDPDFLGTLGDRSPDVSGGRLGRLLLAEVLFYRAVGLDVVGIQLDIDYPTRLLDSYGVFLGALRKGLERDSGCQLSVTCLESWLYSMRFKHLLPFVDFHVPLLFGYTIPADRKKRPSPSPVWRVMTAVWMAEWWGKDYYIGLPAYFPTCVYDEKDRLVSLESDCSLDELSEAPGLEYGGAFRLARTDVFRHRFKVTRSGIAARRRLEQGWIVECEEITPRYLFRCVEGIRTLRPRRCRGAAFYRLFKGPEDQGIHPMGVWSLVHGERSTLYRPLIQIRQEGDRYEVRCRLLNMSPYASFIGGAPCLLQLRIRDGKVLSWDPGGFDGGALGFGFEWKFAASGPERANLVRLFELRMSPDSEVESGDIWIQRTGERFALYLSGSMDGSADLKRRICRDHEVEPDPVEPIFETNEVTLWESGKSF